jgi:hypothetical protein
MREWSQVVGGEMDGGHAQQVIMVMRPRASASKVGTAPRATLCCRISFLKGLQGTDA